MNESRVTIGVVVARSVEVPSSPELITYTIEIDEGGNTAQYEGVAPGDSERISSEFPTFELELVPFRIGQELPVAIRVNGSERRIRIMRGEFPAIEECGS